MSNLRWLDLVTILLYLAGVAWIGFKFSRRQTSTEAYFVARRAIPHWAMGVSLFATIISSITFTAYPGAAYDGNWSALVPGFMVLGVLALAGAIIIPFFRRAVGMSAYEYFGRRFGYGARAYSGVAFAAGHFSKMGFVLYLLAMTVSGMTGWNIYALIMAAGLVTVLYTLAGGLEAVIWTEVLQGFVKVIGLALVLGYLLYIMPGGAPAAFRLAQAHQKFSLGTFDLNFASDGNFWVMSLYGFFWYLQKYTADQTIVQRYLVAKSDRDAIKGVALGAVLCVPVWVLFMLTGTLLWSYYHLSGDVLPAYVDRPEKVFPYFLATKIPAGLAGLFMAALFSAGMSTMSSDLNCLSAVVVTDYYCKWKPASPDRRRLAIGKGVVAVCGLTAMGIALVIALYGDHILLLYYAVSSVIAGGLAGLFLLAFFSTRANRQGVWIGLTANLIFTVWATLTCGKYKMIDLGHCNFPLADVLIGVVGHVIVLVVGYLASWLFPPEALVKREWTIWGWLEKRKVPAGAPAASSP